jgi:predicted acylesterase/phospholipase RssA
MIPGADRRRDAADPDQGSLEHLLAVSEGKVFENLSWRLLQLLVDKVWVDQRSLGEGDQLHISDSVDAVFVTRGSLRSVQDNSVKDEPTVLAAGTVGLVTSRSHGGGPWINGTTEIEARNYRAIGETRVRVFYKLGHRPGEREPAKPASEDTMSRWEWLCKRSLVARRALLSPDAQRDASWSSIRGEVVLLKSKDLVEYLPALTDLLAQSMLCGTDPEDPPLDVCVIRLDQNATMPGWEDRRAGVNGHLKLPVCSVATKGDLETRIQEARKSYDYVFVDVYDRATDLAAVQVKTLGARGRVAEENNRSVSEVPGSSLSQRDFDDLLTSKPKTALSPIDSIVHVARNFRGSRHDDDKLHFYAVILDSRTARFEAGGTRDRRQRRGADEPLRPNVDPPEGNDDNVPMTRLHFNLMRLKKAWEQSPDLHHVCEVLDEPNAPEAGDRRGFWTARGFFERWVRDLRFRRVGVALGGGGATGFCHVALLRGLREQGVPVDMVSGTSFGALVGAYYCSLGLDGLEMLTAQAMLLTGLASLTVVTSAFFEHLVNLSIDYRPMWELPIPLYAVATDIESGTMAIFPGPAAANPSVGFAVRASGSLPGFFGPALAGDARYVDGAAVSNVPVLALIRMGADIVIGANAFPFRKGSDAYKATPFRAFLPPPFGRMAERFIAELNPGNRMTDAARSLSLSLSDEMEKEAKLASAMYTHRRTEVKYWEFHKAGHVLLAAAADLRSADALPAAIDAYRALNARP